MPQEPRDAYANWAKDTPWFPVAQHLANLASYSHYISGIDALNGEVTLPTKESPLRILVASRRIDLQDFEGPNFVHFQSSPSPRTVKVDRAATDHDHRQYEFQLWGLNSKVAGEFDSLIRRLVTNGLREGAHLVTLNEMGFPAPSAYPAHEGYREYFALLRSDPSIPWASYPDHSFYAILGSTHCLDAYTNSTPIYLWDAAEQKDNLFIYQKKTSATKLGEEVRIPSSRRLACLRLGNHFVLPLICLDIFDASQLFALVTHNLRADFEGQTSFLRVSVIVLNSYGMGPLHSSLVREMLERLSFLTASVVIASLSNDRGSERLCYFFGQPIPEPEQVGETSQHSTYPAAAKRVSQDETLFELDRAGLQREIDARLQSGGDGYDLRMQLFHLLNAWRIRARSYRIG